MSSTPRRGLTARPIAGRLHHGFIRQARKHPLRLAFADLLTPKVSYIKALAGSIAIARALRGAWEGQANVGVLLPASVGGALVNLAAALAGKAVVNLNFTTGRAGMDSAAAQAGLEDGRHQPSVPRERKARAAVAGRADLSRRRDDRDQPQRPLECSRAGDPRPGSRAGTFGRVGRRSRRSTTPPPSSSAAAARVSPRGSSFLTSISIPTSRPSPRSIASCLPIA